MLDLKIGCGVVICRIEPANPADQRGPTWQWKPDAPKQITVCVRKAGSTSCHVHTGIDPSKNPECLFLVRGKINLTCYDITATRRGEWIVEAGSAIEIDPNIIHKVEVLEDAIFIESRVTEFDKEHPDTVTAEIPA